MGQRVQLDQLTIDSPKRNIGTVTRQRLDKVFDILDTNFDYAGKVFYENVSGVDSLIRVSPSPIQRVQGTDQTTIGNADYESLASTYNLFYSYPQSNLDLATGSTSGSIDVGTVPTTTSGYWRWMLISAKGTAGQYQLSFGDAVSGMPSFGTSMPVKPTGNIELCSIRLHNSGGGTWNYLRPSITDFFNHVRGGGGGSGTGNANEIEERFKDILATSSFDYMTPSIGGKQALTFIDSVSGNITVDPNSSSYKFTSASDKLYTSNLFPTDFYAKEVDLDKVELVAYWDATNGIDTAATYEVTREGSANFPSYQTISMTRIDTTSDGYRGTLTFAAEGSNSYTNNINTGAFTWDGSSNTQISRSFSDSTKGIYNKTIGFNIAKTGSPQGTFTFTFVRDNAGSPSTNPADVISSVVVPVSSLANGANTISLTSAFNKSTTYWLTVVSDAAYRSSYSAGVTQVAITSTNSNVQLQGRLLDLRVKITSSAGNKYLAGLSVFFKNANVIQTIQTRNILFQGPTYLDNYRRLQGTDFPSITNLFGWHNDGTSSFYGTSWVGGVDLTLIGSTSARTTNINDSVYCDLNGTTTAFYANSTAFDTANEDFTVGGWLYFDTLTNASELVLSKYSATSADASWYLGHDSSGNLNFRVFYNNSAGSIVITIPSASVKDSKWHHIVCQYSQVANSITMFVDGKLVSYTSNASLATRNNNANSKLTFGSYGNGTAVGAITNGAGCDFFYSKTALTFDQIRQIYIAGTKKFAYLDENSYVRIQGENVDPTQYATPLSVTSNVVTGFAVVKSQAIAYKANDGQWRLRGNITTTCTATSTTGVTWTISGVSFDTTSNNFQAVTPTIYAGVTAVNSIAYALGANIAFSHASASVTNVNASFDCALTSKPTFLPSWIN